MPFVPGPDQVSVVICAWTERRWDAIRRAARSVLAQSPAPAELIVVVDHNGPLLERLSGYLDAIADERAVAGTRLVAISSAERPGRCGGRNTGVRAAAGEIVAFLDDDARARPGWLAALLDAFREPGVIGVGGAALPDWEAGARPAWFPPEFDWVVGCTWRGLPEARAEVRNVIGSNMAFRRSALEAAGAFHAGLGRIGSRPVGGEETDISIRARRAVPGGRIVLEPAAAVDHLVPADRARWSYFFARCVGEGRSKAVLAARAGAEGLASESTYVRRVLPAAFGRALLEAIEGDRGAFGRMAAIVGGLAATAGGFLEARLAARRGGGAGVRPEAA